MKITPTERRIQRRRRRRLLFALAGAVAFLTYTARAFFGESGILVGLQVKSEYRRLQDHNAELAAENRQLAEQIREMKEDPRRIEAIGRSEFGFGRPGEIVFRFPDRSSKESPAN